MAAADLWRRVGARVPVIQAPMAGAGGVELAAAVIAGGGVGSLPGAMVQPAELVEQAAAVRARVDGPLLLNFFCHDEPARDDARDQAWLDCLQPFYALEGVDRPATLDSGRRPFDAEAAAAVEAVRPAVVSFHFGLPASSMLDRVRATGALVFATATTVAEAEWLAGRGCDAIIAQGFEAGGHAGWFLDGHRPVGAMALVPRIVDAVSAPVLAAGGIADARGVRAAIALGAAGVQVGTAYLACPESLASATVRARLGERAGRETEFISILTGRAARGFSNRLVEMLGPMRSEVPPFPRTAGAVGPLRAKAEHHGRADYSSLWAGQAAPLARPIGARMLTETLGAAALAALEIY